MTVYIVTILLTSITSFIAQYIKESKKSNNGSKFFAFITAFILIIVSGFRWNVGTDYGRYASAYDLYKHQVKESLLVFDEPGIKIVSWASGLFYDNYVTMFFISALITIGLFVWTYYKYSDSFFISILLFIFGHGWTDSFNGVRQLIASSILFSGHYFIIKRKFFPYFLVVLLASSFHISALPMILLYFVPQTKITFKRIFILLILIILSLQLYDFFFLAINNVMLFFGGSGLFISDYMVREINILRILVMIAPAILYLFITPRDKLNKKDNFYINMIFLNAAIYIVSSNSTYLARFALYTIVYVPMAIPVIIKRIDSKIGRIILYIILILYFIYWSYDISTVENLINFQWIFER